MKHSIQKIGFGVGIYMSMLLGSAYGQAPQRFVYVNVEYILAAMPEAKQVDSDLQAYEKQLKTRLEAKIKEFQTKGSDLEQNYTKLTDLERADKQEELQTMQESIIKFQQEAELAMQKKQQDLLKPLYQKIQASIDKIGKAQGYGYIFKAEALLYARPSDDISAAVLKDLGITPPASANSTNK